MKVIANALSAGFVRRDLSGGEKPLPSGRRSGPVGAEGSPSREVSVRVGAALTKPGRRWMAVFICASTAHTQATIGRARPFRNRR